MKRQELAELFRALGDPTRLAIVEILLQGTHCNCELSQSLGLSASLISHHMHILTDLGLVIAERQPQDRRWIYYRLNLEKLGELSTALAHFFGVSHIPDRNPDCASSGCICNCEDTTV